jgi:hypothetical protein
LIYKRVFASESPPGEKTPLFGRFYTKKEHFTPRQARDKHRKNSKKMPFFAPSRSSACRVWAAGLVSS